MGGVILVIFSILLALPYPKNKIIESMLAIILGSIVPGILSKVEERLYPKQ